MNTTEILLICATIAGPILAVQAQKWVERTTDHKRRKQYIFETLMATRATRLAPEHVRALNQIDLVYVGSNHLWFSFPTTKAERTVLDKWKEYSEILNETAVNDPASYDAWTRRASDRFTDLLQAIGEEQKLHFDKVALSKSIYHPQGFVDDEGRRRYLTDRLLSLVSDDGFRMKVVSFPQPTPEAIEQLAELQKRIISAISLDGRLRVDAEAAHTLQQPASLAAILAALKSPSQ